MTKNTASQGSADASYGGTDASSVWKVIWSSEVKEHEQVFDIDGEPLLSSPNVSKFFQALGFRGGTGQRSQQGLPILQISSPKLLEWASLQGFLDTGSMPTDSLMLRNQHFLFSCRHAISYLWQFYSRGVCAISQSPALGDFSGELSRPQQDFERCARILALDAEQRGVDAADCADIDSLRKVVQDQLFAATSVETDAEFMCESIPVLCTHMTPNPMLAYGLLLGTSPALVVGPAALPKVHAWMSLLLGLPTRGDATDINLQALLQENMSLRREIELRKRGRADELEVSGNVVAIAKRAKHCDAAGQAARDKMNMLSAIHAVKCKIAFRNVTTSLRDALGIIQEMDPNFQPTHVFADMSCKQTLTRSCVDLSDALDAYYRDVIREARGLHYIAS